jgi:sec-independent protein translocase protein TatC
MMETQKTDPDSADGGFISHLIELRGRLLRMIVAVLLMLICLLPFANKLYSWLALPLLKHLPGNSTMIAIDIVSPFMVPFKLAAMLAVFLVMPYLLYQIWAFIAPGLYRHEKRLALPLLVSSTVLFYSGVAFAYFVVLPMLFMFIIGFAPEGVAVMTDIGRYFDFVLAMFLVFGFIFEVPVATVLLVVTGITTADALAAKRSYVIVAAFVIGMVLTPPDVISQTLMAGSIWLLYEAGLIAARLMSKQKITAGSAAG